MQRFWAFVLAVGVLVAAAAPSVARELDSEIRYRLSRDGGGLGYEIDETVLFLRAEPDDGTRAFWIVERKVKERMIMRVLQDAHQWIDGRTCPAVERLLRDLASMPPLTMAGPDTSHSSLPPSDVPRTRFAGPAVVQDSKWRGVEVIRSEYFGPVARWWDLGQKALEGCWRDAPVDTPDGQVRAYLTTPEQVRWMKP